MGQMVIRQVGKPTVVNTERNIHVLQVHGCGGGYDSWSNHNFGSWTQTVSPTCVDTGVERRWCSTCGYGASRAVSSLGHSLSGWKQSTTQHWKVCNRCNATENTGNHVDADVNGYCDTCNYLMAIPVSATISSAVSVKEGASASFSISVTAGTNPITYQWYYNTSNSTSGGTAVPGATSTLLSIATTTKDMNGRYYYCAMSNKAGTKYSPTAKLTVYYPFTLGTHPQDANLKKGESATFSVGIGTAGNPNSYTYQWYIASSATGAGNKITGATGSSYTVTPTANVHEAYYYCVVSNGQYEVISNRAKLVADVTIPTITMGTFNQNLIINKDVTLTIPFTVTDTGEGYVEGGSNFTASDFVIKTDGAINSNVTKNLTYNGASGNTYSYTLTISNMTGNGALSLEVPADSIEDNFHNKNIFSNFNTNVVVDNVKPKVAFESLVSGTNGKYANKDKTIVIRLSVTEAVGMETSQFEASDIIVKVGDATLGEDLIRSLRYINKTGNKYIYDLTLQNIIGNGDLSLVVNADKMRDLANNPNEAVSFPVKNTTGETVVIDNQKPTIDSLSTKLGGYTSSKDYPTSLAANHLGWANEDIYVQINATDNEQIDYYTRSEDNVTHTKMTINQHIISTSINTTMVYRVYDMAGNYSEISREIKLDKITPNQPVLLMTEQRQNGSPYVFDINEPTSKTVYIIPDVSTIVDKGAVQSGIDLDRAYTYYTVTRYKEIDKAVMVGEVGVYRYDELVILKDSGYYEVQITMTDIAGNQVQTQPPLFRIYINKGVENTIRIKNINDIGSGISKVTINIYFDNGKEAIPEIVIENPYKEIIKNVRLREGTFTVKVTLTDKVGNTKLLTTTITNVF